MSKCSKGDRFSANRRPGRSAFAKSGNPFLLSATGMRIGEVLALRALDLDFQRKLIKVRCSTYAGQIGTPKSKASIADLPMPPALESRLKKYRSSGHYRKNDLGLLFVNRRGRPYSANKLREKKLRPLLTRLRIPLAGFHAFRACGSQRTHRQRRANYSGTGPVAAQRSAHHTRAVRACNWLHRGCCTD